MPYKSKDLLITYDETIGAIYHTLTGTLFSVSSDEGRLIGEMQDRYEKGQCSDEEVNEFISFFDEALKDKSPRMCQDYPRMDQIKRLEGLRLLVSTDCNLRCKYCYADGGSYGHARETLTPEKAIEYIDAILLGRYNHLSTFDFFGGEPTLSPKTIVAVCEHFKELVNVGHIDAMPHISMITNCTLITEYLAEIISNYDIQLVISVDGDKVVNDMQRVKVDGTGSYDDIVVSLDLLRQKGVYPTLAEATYTKNHMAYGYTLDDVAKQISADLGIPRTIVVPCVDHGNSLGVSGLDVEHMDVEESTIDDLLVNFESLNDIESAVFNDLFKVGRMISGTYSNAVCAIGLASMTVFPNGEIYPCHLFGDKREYILGSIDKGILSFRESTLDRMYGYKKSERECCRNCWQRTFCKGCLAFDWIPHKCDELSEKNKNTILSLARLRKNNERWDEFIEIVRRMDLSRFE